MLKAVFLFLTLLLASGCIPRKTPLHVRRRFADCLANGGDQIAGRIADGGYFAEPDSSGAMVRRTVFYPDGSFLDGDWYASRKLCSEWGDTSTILNRGDWGLFRISGNQIIARAIHPGITLNDPWYCYETRYRILDRQTIQRISWMELESALTRTRNPGTHDRPAAFVPCRQMPSTSCWLKKERWYRCGERDTRK